MKHAFYDWFGLNERLFYLINYFHTDWYDWLMVLADAVGLHTIFPLYMSIIAAFAAVGAWYRCLYNPEKFYPFVAKWFEVIIVLFLAKMVSNIWVPGLKEFFHYPRPIAILPEFSFIVIDKTESPLASMPSGHSAFGMMMGAGLWSALNRGGKILAAIYVFWMGWARIALGVHFPADVFYSMVFSLVTILIIRSSYRNFLPIIKNCLAFIYTSCKKPSPPPQVPTIRR